MSKHLKPDTVPRRYPLRKVMKKVTVTLACCLLLGASAVVALYATTYEVIHRPNSFLRTYKQYVAEKTCELDLSVNSWYVAGTTHDRIYLGNITAPFQLLITDYSLRDTSHITMQVEGMDTTTFYKTAIVRIDSPYFYIADGFMPGIFRGRIGEWRTAKRIPEYNEYFTQLLPLGPSSFGIRSNRPKTREHVLAKLQRSEPVFTMDTTLLQKQLDGFFCTDGMLTYDAALHRLVYTYYYRNEFIVYDTSLKLGYRGHTIDTFRRANIRIGHISSENTNTLTYKRTTNLATWSSGNHHYILSNLLARNDRPDLFPLMSIVDVYDLRFDRYRFSFLLTNSDAENKLREFRMIDDKILIGIAGNHLVCYTMRDGWLDEPSL